MVVVQRRLTSAWRGEWVDIAWAVGTLWRSRPDEAANRES